MADQKVEKQNWTISFSGKKFFTHLQLKGRDINHTTFTYPQLFSKQDASEDALGGYTCIGIAWRFIIPVEARKLVHINILEFMAIVITTWLSIEILQIRDGQGAKIFAQTDNTSALGWLQASTRFDASNRASTYLREKIGRKLAELLIDADLGLYSQHVPGRENLVADHLSRAIDMSSRSHISRIRANFPNHLPQEGLTIVNLPEEISSWILSTLEDGIQIMALPKAQKRSSIQALRNGALTQPAPTSTFSSKQLLLRGKFKSSVVSRTKSDIISIATDMNMSLKGPQFEPTSITYQRPSDRKVIPTPFV